MNFVPVGSGKKYKQCCMNKQTTDVINNKMVKIGEKEFDVEMMTNFFNNFQKLMLRNKPNIKKYEKIRKLHGEVIDSMMNYNDSGKFELKFLAEISKILSVLLFQKPNQVCLAGFLPS